MEKWKRLGSRYIHRDEWVTLRADDCELPNGKVLSPFYVYEEKDWAHVVAVDEIDRILAIRQYRYAADAFCWEIPCGVVDEGEDPLMAAKRELKEETGFVAREWTLIGTPYANPARQTNRIQCFLARGLSDTGETNFDESEEIEHELMTVAELKTKIAGGSFSQSLHIASLYMVLDYLGL